MHVDKIFAFNSAPFSLFLQWPYIRNTSLQLNGKEVSCTRFVAVVVGIKLPLFLLRFDTLEKTLFYIVYKFCDCKIPFYIDDGNTINCSISILLYLVIVRHFPWLIGEHERTFTNTELL